jgi:DNA polymerase I-like protein with 3'-5' exonuclease and polymerase domains
MAWGHGDGSKAAGNNCAEKEARAEYKKAHDSRYRVLFQNGAFDQDVAEVHWDIPLLPWERYDDTLFLAFLNNPHSPTLALKPLAELLLSIPPEEQDRMYEWIIASVPEAARKPSTAGAYIWRCPYQVVKPYHKGDLTRTLGLFNYLYPQVIDAGMGEAYDRERKLMPILLRNAREGMRVDVAGLERDLPLMKQGVEKADVWLRRRLGDINLDSDKQLAESLLSTGSVTDLERTPKGQLSVSKKSLTIDKFRDERVFQALSYRSKMSTCINMFVEPWLDLSKSDGVIHPNWSQVRSPKGGGNDTNGARSGRIICTRPNFLNIPKRFKKDISAGYKHPAFLRTIELPYIRTYCLPDKGKAWGRRDFSQQEVRLVANAEDGPMMQGFLNDPNYDIHELVRAETEKALQAAGLRGSFDRDTAKTVVFGRIYGQGLSGLMQSLKLGESERSVAKVIQNAINTALPTLKELDDAMKALFKRGEPIRTIGGRLYYCEPSTYSEKYGRDLDYSYKALNYYAQGGGADVTKQTLILYDEHPKRQGRMTVSVYDEVDFSCAKSNMRGEMKILRECMLTSLPCDVPLLSDGETGPNWGTLKAWKE